MNTISILLEKLAPEVHAYEFIMVQYWLKTIASFQLDTMELLLVMPIAMIWVFVFEMN